MSKNLSELLGRKGVSENLFDKLGNTSKGNEAISQDQMDKLASDFLVGKANVYGATTFYDFLKEDNKNKKVYVCNGTACECAGTQGNLNTQLLNHFKPEEIGHMCCLGRCHENGAFHFNGDNYSAKSNDDVSAIVSGDKIKNSDTYNVSSTGESVLTGSQITISDFKSELINVFDKGKIESLAEIKTSNVRGRGGAGFPMGFKLESCMNIENELKFIICNADEGDPGAFSDRYLLEKQPLLVLFGMMVSGYITGAEWGLLYIRAEYPESVTIIEKAVKKLYEENLLGSDILGSGFNYNFRVIKAQGAYICGEETALINSIEGQRPEVRTRPPYPTEQGLFNKPTIVNNVETLASVYNIINHGGGAFNKIGTESSSGTKLVCLDSFFNKPGIYEVEMGYSLADLIYKDAGGFKKPVKAMQIGGPLGGVVPIHKIDELTIDFESFANTGFLLGHASVVCIPENFPMVKYIEHLFDFAAYESCGKCFPCRLGTKRGHEMFSKAINEDYKIEKSLIQDLLETLEVGSLCAHGGGIPLPIKNILHYFKDELSPYIKED
jgi:NADH:ubiquinone oxidoreductase subunit F (NADH-binding)/NADH:ubiquinone oxidoreductase subunit E